MHDFRDTELGRRFAAALRSRDEGRLKLMEDELATLLSANGLMPEMSLQAIAMAQSERRWTSVVEMAEALLAAEDQFGPEISRRYAQALIELGAFTAAAKVLQDLIDDEPGDQLDEVLGLQGRIAKQRYIKYGKPAELCSSLEAYAAGYQSPGADRIWLGGNLLALIRRAGRDEVTTPTGLPTPDELEADLSTAINARGSSVRTVWNCASEIELMLSRGNERSAADLAAQLADTEHASPFELASLRRQLVEVWQLDLSNDIVSALGESMLRLGAGSDTPVPDSQALEKLLGAERPVEYGTYLRGVSVARTVCRITDPYGNPVGTGFVLKGSEIFADWGEELILLTNAHVVTAHSFPRALQASEARANFTALEAHSPHAPLVTDLKIRWSSPPDELDATIIELSAPQQLVDSVQAPGELAQLANSLPSMNEADPYVYVIGHPQGRPLSLSIRGNGLLDVDDQRLHYLAPTEPGSSGSPVFNANWDLIGLHHAGAMTMPRLGRPEERYPANEASTLFAIRDAVAKDF